MDHLTAQLHLYMDPVYPLTDPACPLMDPACPLIAQQYLHMDLMDLAWPPLHTDPHTAHQFRHMDPACLLMDRLTAHQCLRMDQAWPPPHTSPLIAHQCLRMDLMDLVHPLPHTDLVYLLHPMDQVFHLLRMDLPRMDMGATRNTEAVDGLQS